MSERQQRRKRAQTSAQQQAAGVTQPSLLLAASRAEERFQAFHRAHPEVYREFARRALALHARGWRHFGAKAIFEALRYDTALGAGPEEAPYRLNNNLVSRYSRMLTDEHPELRGFFEQRVLRSA